MAVTKEMHNAADKWAREQPRNTWHSPPIRPVGIVRQTLYAVEFENGRILTGTILAFSNGALAHIYARGYGEPTSWLPIPSSVFTIQQNKS